MAPQSAHPPSLPPTVEEAYRRKCIQLKERSKEIEDENDAYRLRLSRLRRQIQKLRLERAFLLDQVAKRTSTNVEDSDGSPSPPPTPQDKPMRAKRGHRKLTLPSCRSDILKTGPNLGPIKDDGKDDGKDTGKNAEDTLSGSPPQDQDHTTYMLSGSPLNEEHHAAYNTQSTNSEAFSHSLLETQKEQGQSPDDTPKPPKRPSNAFEIYCNDTRPLLQDQHKEAIVAGEYPLEQELARGWKDLPEADRKQFQLRYDHAVSQYKEARETFKQSVKEAAARERSRARENRTSRGGRNRTQEAQDDEDADDDQDVEMIEAEPGADQDTDPETEVDENEGAD